MVYEVFMSNPRTAYADQAASAQAARTAGAPTFDQRAMEQAYSAPAADAVDRGAVLWFTATPLFFRMQNSARLERELGFVPSRSVGDGVHDLVAAFRAGLLPDPLVSDRYYNIRTMKARAIA